MNQQKTTMLSFVGRNALLNGLTYILFGLAASVLFNYRELWADYLVSVGYRPIDSPWVMAGPVLQPLRGAFYGLILWPFRDRIVEMKRGWLALFGLFFGLGIFGTFAAPLSSFEGLIYTSHPLKLHLLGIPEICGHALLYSWLLYHWEAETKISRIITRCIKATAYALLPMVLFIVMGMIMAGAAGLSTDGVSLGQYLGLLFSTLFLGAAAFLLQPKKLRFWGVLGILTLVMSLPMVVISLISGSTLANSLGQILFCVLAVIPSGLFLAKRKEKSQGKGK